jgi:ferredoxin-like protein FixX
MLAKQFDPKALSPSSKSKETTKNGQEDPVFEEDPVFKPNDTEFRKYVATTANEIRKAKGGRKSQFQKFLEDEKMNAARLGSATNFQHLKVKSESESTTCVVCCKHCPGGHHTKNKRYGAETKSQCSICLVNLCDFVRAPFTKTCFELFHSILEPPSHPQLRGVSLSFRPNLFPIHSTPDRVASNSSRSRKSKPVSTTQETAQDQVDYSSDESTSSDLDSLSDVYDNSSIDDQQSTTNSNPEDSTRQGSKKMKHDVAPIPLNLDMDDDPNNEDE